MPKVFLPLYSIRAWGYFPRPIAHWIQGYPNGFPYPGIFQRRKTWHGTINILEKYYKPTNPQTPAQQANRQKFEAARLTWSGLTSTEQDYYNRLKYPPQMSGYNRYVKQYLKNL